MAEKSRIVEEALNDLKKIQAALNSNTKEMLLSIAREEIDGLVKESLNENDYEEDEVGPDGDDTTGDEGTGESEPAAEEPTVGGEAPEGEPEEEPAIPAPTEVGDGQEDGMDADALDGGDDIDMRDASDDDVLAIYKKLSGEDEIEIHLNITEPGQYILKKGALGGAEGEAPIASTEPEIGVAPDAEISMGDETPEVGAEEPAIGGEAPEFGGGEEGTDDEEPVYEIAMDDDEAITENETEEEGEIKETEEEEGVVKEAIPVGLAQSKRLPGKVDIGQPRGAGAKESQKESVAKSTSLITESESYKKLLTESNKLKKENIEFRGALKDFRNKLVETVVFNANLSYVVRLFMEHATTKDEKQSIIKRFDDEVTNLVESKKLYKTIANELAVRKPISESVENKIIKEVNTSSSKKLTEANAYVDPSAQRIKELIKRVENKK